MLSAELWRAISSFTAGPAPAHISQVCTSCLAARRLKSAKQWFIVLDELWLGENEQKALACVCWTLFQQSFVFDDGSSSTASRDSHQSFWDEWSIDSDGTA